MDKTPEKKSITELYQSSLLAKLTLSMLKAALLLGTILFILGLGLYTYTLLGQYITESYSLAKSSARIVERIGDADELARMVMDVYEDIPEDLRQDQASPEYRKRFDALELEENDAYQNLKSILSDIADSSDVSYLYIAMYDPKTHALIYVCDPDKDPETQCKIGEWEEIKDEEMRKFTEWKDGDQIYDVGGSSRHGWMCTSGYPLGSTEDNLHCFVLADITLKGVYNGIRILLCEYAVTVILVLALLGRKLNKRMKAILVDPIEKIGNAAMKYVRDRREGKTATDHFDNLDINTGDEIENLALIMADMEHNIGEHEEAIVALAAEREREHTELDLATRIQMDMLPSTFPAFPDRNDFDIYAVMDPAREVGGDFYDFFLIDDDHLGLVMADVSGKGVPAALFMMASMIITANTANSIPGYDPGEMLETANNMICAHNSEDMFVTMWLGILDTRTGLLRAANAGHEYPAIKKADGSFELYKDKHGFVLGTMEDMKYKSYEIQLEKGDKIFVYTDGVPEATDADEQLFGTDRMIDALNEDPDADPKKLLENVKAAVDRFVKNEPQFDDLTMLGFEYKGAGDKGSEDKAAEETGVKDKCVEDKAAEE